MADLRADGGGTGGELSRTWRGGIDEEANGDNEGEGKRREAKCSRFRCDMN